MKTNDKSLPIEHIVEHIVTLNTGLRDFWSSSHGWASNEAADLLTRSRLDWQVSLSYSLKRWLSSPTLNEAFAVQILGYANIGALVEGTLKLFLSIYFPDYKSDAAAKSKNGTTLDPDGISLDQLRQFFKKRIWGSTPEDNWDPWILRIQNRRNAIHAFKDRNIGSHSELIQDIHAYLRLLRRINYQLPYPDDIAEPFECLQAGCFTYSSEKDAPKL